MPSESPAGESGSSPALTGWKRTLLRLTLWAFGLLFAAVASVLIIVGVALSVAYPNLPDISDLSDYRPKLPLRVYSAEGVLIGEFG